MGEGGLMTTVLTVFGTRPEAIKLAPVLREFHKGRGADPGAGGGPIRSRTCVTGQHREMLDQVLQLFGIVPDHDLQIMTENQTLAGVAAAALTGLESVIRTERPDWVLVQGDTTTAAAAALAAYYARVRVGHVEAGLRTHDKWQPFPEEINRQVVGAIADLHFAPTGRARDNLLREGVPSERILVTGNTVIDALHWVAAQPWDPGRADEAARERLTAALAGTARVVLVTAHRRENFGAPLVSICHALRELASRYAHGLRFVYPVHRNPNVWEPVHRLLGDVPNIVLVPPLDYLSLVHVMKRAHLVVTDSGGLQEEAPGLGKPVLVLREVTERPEGVDAHTVKVVGTDQGRIVAETVRLLEDGEAYARMARAINPYGDGHAAPRIVSRLLQGTSGPLVPAERLATMPANGQGITADR
jgi:UDP-N-acetylglucosamine 2-epimerase (non-hydrolysing)